MYTLSLIATRIQRPKLSRRVQLVIGENMPASVLQSVCRVLTDIPLPDNVSIAVETDDTLTTLMLDCPSTRTALKCANMLRPAISRLSCEG